MFSIFIQIHLQDKTKKVTHQWVSACYGSAHACDWCRKPLTNKPALYCESNNTLLFYIRLNISIEVQVNWKKAYRKIKMYR